MNEVLSPENFLSSELSWSFASIFPPPYLGNLGEEALNRRSSVAGCVHTCVDKLFNFLDPLFAGKFCIVLRGRPSKAEARTEVEIRSSCGSPTRSFRLHCLPYGP